MDKNREPEKDYPTRNKAFVLSFAIRKTYTSCCLEPEKQIYKETLSHF